MVLAGQQVAPPLQPHLARQRLADLFPHPRNLDIEGVDRQQRAALRRRHEQRGGIAGKIMRPHQVGAVFGGGFVGFEAAHGTAINAAATRRRSPIMML